MNHVSISQLKTAPQKAISRSIDLPLAIQNRNQTQAYIIGKDLYEKIVSQLENQTDKKAIESADFSKGKPLEEIEAELGL